MAEGKKGFILYADLLTVVEKLVLKDRENKTNYAGELFLCILMYVNDKKPVPIDFIVEMAFEPIKLSLKRDLEKFEAVKVKRSGAGKKSAELRALKKSQQNATNPTSVESVKLISTNPTVSVNESESVSESVKESVSVKVIKKSILDRKAEFKNSLQQFLEEFGSDILNNFYIYWTEHGERDRKMRFEKEKSFNKKLRLDKWLKNSLEWKKEKSSAKKENVSLADKMKKQYGLN